MGVKKLHLLGIKAFLAQSAPHACKSPSSQPSPPLGEKALFTEARRSSVYFRISIPHMNVKKALALPGRGFG